MDVKWYVNRLGRMSPGEVAWRVGRAFSQMRAKAARDARSARYEKCDGQPDGLPAALDRVRFYGLADVTPEDVPQAWVDRTVAAAERLLQHRHTIFALKDVYLGHPIRWNREHKRGIDLPLEFGLWMDYRDVAAFGDCKYIWEPARFQHIITLAKAYYLTGDERFAREVVEQIAGFMEQCPYLLGAHWAMAMEAGIRLISVSWAAMFMKGYLRNDAQACRLISRFVASHADFVAANLSFYSSANNHLIGELAGLFLAGVCFSHLPNMQRHLAAAYRIAGREIVRQFYSDGVNCEQSTCYHISCYQSFLLMGLLGRDNDLPFGREFWARLEGGTRFIAEMTCGDLTIPQIGDNDDGINISLSERRDNWVQSLLAVGTALFGGADFTARTQEFDETAFWLLGKSGRSKYDSVAPAEKVRSSVAFEQGGYYLLRSGPPAEVTVVFDCGPLGMGAIAAHGHADALSVLLHAHGREFLIDPGTYTYAANDPWRNHFRSTAAHNTLVVDGQDQSEMAGPFLWTRRAEARVEQWAPGGQVDRVCGWHDGYRRLPDPVTHRRTVELDKAALVLSVRDRIEAGGRHEVAQYWHVSPQCDVERIGENALQITNDGRAIRLIADPKLSCEVLRASDDPRAGWVSRSYDEKVPTNTLVCRATIEGNQEFATRIELTCS